MGWDHIMKESILIVSVFLIALGGSICLDEMQYLDWWVRMILWMIMFLGLLWMLMMILGVI